MSAVPCGKVGAGRCPCGVRGNRAAGSSCKLLEGRPMTDLFSKGSPGVAGKGWWCWVAAVVLCFSCSSPALSFPICPPHALQPLDCQSLSRGWVLCYSAWRQGAATPSALDCEETTKPAKISHCIKLHSDGNEIIVLSLSICHQASEPKLKVDQLLALTLTGFGEWINLVIND